MCGGGCAGRAGVGRAGHFPLAVVWRGYPTCSCKLGGFSMKTSRPALTMADDP